MRIPSLLHTGTVLVVKLALGSSRWLMAYVVHASLVNNEGCTHPTSKDEKCNSEGWNLLNF